MLKFLIVFVLLLVLELLYFKIAERFRIIDKPNERSSYSKVVLRGGGIIFLLAVWIWCAFYGVHYPWFLAALTVVSVISFVDDNHSLPASVRLVGQLLCMAMLLWQLIVESEGAALLSYSAFSKILLFIVAMIVYVGATDIYNFMDGINGITAGYSLAVLVPLLVLNREWQFVNESFIVVMILADLVFGFFNFRPKGKAKCFAGDVGSIGMAFILLFMIGLLIMRTSDISWLVALFMVYGVDGCLTIIHRIMLHENITHAHRKHAYQIMANELKIGHVKVSSFYMLLQLVISLVFIWVIPDTVLAHWIYLGAVAVVLSMGYILFMKKYYHLHEEYLESLSL